MKVTDKNINLQCTRAISVFLNHKNDNKARGNMILTFLAHEAKLKKGAEKDKSMWFKFFPGDTTVTTIEDIKKDLNLPSSHNNYKYIIEKMEIAVENNSLEIYFS